MSSNLSNTLQKWRESANAWIKDQSQSGDWSRRVILDPNLEAILPNLTNKQVLDLGCGEGRYARILKSKGAIVTGVDPVPEFISHAKSLDADSIYIEAAAESLPLPDQQFDLVLSYLTIIDIPDLEAASREINRVLKPGGELIIVTLSNMASCTDNWVKDSKGKKLYRTVDRYMEHFSMDLEWRGIKITNFHRPLSYVLGLFLNQNFVLTKFIEPLPDQQNPQYTDEFRCPNFQIYVLQKT
jgi:ubiquinone/menaquinone biosynthesis C-methylase UbiE